MRAKAPGDGPVPGSTGLRTVALLLATVAGGVTPRAVAAQDCRAVEPGDRVRYRLLGRAGIQSAELVELGRDYMAVTTGDGVRSHAADRLRDVEVHCTLEHPERRRSAMVGGAVGAVLGLVAGLVISNNSPNDGQIADTSNQPWIGPRPLVGVGIGGAAGAALGALLAPTRTWQPVRFPGTGALLPLLRVGSDGRLSLELRIAVTGPR